MCGQGNFSKVGAGLPNSSKIEADFGSIGIYPRKFSEFRAGYAKIGVLGVQIRKFASGRLEIAFFTAELDFPRVNAPFDVPRFKLINMGRKWSHSAAIS